MADEIASSGAEPSPSCVQVIDGSKCAGSSTPTSSKKASPSRSDALEATTPRSSMMQVIKRDVRPSRNGRVNPSQGQILSVLQIGPGLMPRAAGF
jgi:hypothetical protein